MAVSAYEYKCCVTDLAIPELLNASHISPWSVDVKNRVNPHNGLCLNTLHDRMFDRGLITITAQYTIKVSKRLHDIPSLGSLAPSILASEGKQIRLPERFLPDPTLLAYHESSIFLG